MKNSRLMSLALAGLCLSGRAFAQGSAPDVPALLGFGPRLGVRVAEVDKVAVNRLKLQGEKGVLVTEVLDSSAASKAGIRKDDVIVTFQGEPVLTVAQFGRLVREVPTGRKVDIDILRASAPLRMTVTIERVEPLLSKAGIPDIDSFGRTLDETFAMLRDERARSLQAVGPSGGIPTWPPGRESGLGTSPPRGLMLFPSGKGQLGITCSDIAGQLAVYFKAPSNTAALVSSVVQGSAADKAGIKAGDLIVRLGEIPVQDTSDLQRAIAGLNPGERAKVTVWRSGAGIDLSVIVDKVP